MTAIMVTRCQKNELIFKNRWLSLSFLTVIITIAAGGAFGKYSGGSGTAGVPYRIATRADLLALAADTGDYNKCFILTADINLIGQIFSAAIIAADGSPAFSGTFDGSGHKITNFTINTNNYDHGLFGTITGGLVENLGIENCSVSGYYAGCLAGFTSGGTISNCYSTGSVSGDSSCASVGNLVGENWGTISDCYSTGSVSGASTYVGGLVGRNMGIVSRCYAAGAVSGSYDLGGLAGNNDGSISNCYSAGTVSGSEIVGGLVGINHSNITNCYATGAVSGSYNLGGLVGYQSGAGASAVSSFWDTQTSGRATSAGGTGKTTAQMKTLSTFTSAGWDFVEIWGIEEIQTYPYLPALPGDLNHDKKVNFKDFAIFASHWLEGI